jgi:hypothetical protein
LPHSWMWACGLLMWPHCLRMTHDEKPLWSN